FWALVFAYFGSMFWYILQHAWGREPYDTSDWTLLMDSAGSVLYGWILGGIPAVWWACRRQKISLARTFDALGPGLLVAQALNRFGCFAGQCCYGKPTTLPW